MKRSSNKIQFQIISLIFKEDFANFPRWDAHRRVWLCGMMHTAESDSVVGCTQPSFLKIWISQRNGNRIWKYFSLFIRGPDGFESWKKWRSKISWHTPFKGIRWPSMVNVPYMREVRLHHVILFKSSEKKRRIRRNKYHQLQNDINFI